MFSKKQQEGRFPSGAEPEGGAFFLPFKILLFFGSLCYTRNNILYNEKIITDTVRKKFRQRSTDDETSIGRETVQALGCGKLGKGIAEKDPDGSRHGLVVDYLNEIAKYTGWEYEYIDTTPETMLKGFAEGEYELMGGNYYLPGLEEYCSYPDYNIGYSKSVIFARENDDSVQSHNLKSLNGKTIGVYDRAVENIRRLKEYLSMNDMDCTLIYYSYEQLMDGNLYPYLKEGKIDLLLGNSVEQRQGIRAVASYDSQPYYIVTNAGKQEILGIIC